VTQELLGGSTEQSGSVDDKAGEKLLEAGDGPPPGRESRRAEG